MSLARLQIQNLRKMQSAQFDLHPHLNLVIGANGSGKTSFLEAIYLLGSGHSFRTREISPLIRLDTDTLTVFARTSDNQSISIQKSRSNSTQVRLNNHTCLSSSELARFLPCQVFYQDLFHIIEAGPAVRRSLLDWGLFHVEHRYHLLWKNYRRALKQRNSLLKQRATQAQIIPWNLTLADLAMQLDSFRRIYFTQLSEAFAKLLPQLTDLSCNLNYYKGWDRKETNKHLTTILADSYSTDLQRQFTQYGAHQADLFIDTNTLKAKHYLSRGQQKIILIALKLAQAQLLQSPCVFLCDDLASELDEPHLSRLLTLMKNMRGQFFITSLDAQALPIAWAECEYAAFFLPNK